MTVMPLVLAATLAFATAASLAAQEPAPPPEPAPDTSTLVRPGMSEQDVRVRWGEPVTVRRVNDWTYLFYENGRERATGMYDVVFLQNGQVVDAIVRAEGRVYAGTSSSPEGRVPEFTPPRTTPATGAEVGGARVNPAPRPER